MLHLFTGRDTSGLAKTAVALAELREPGMLGTPYAIPTALDNMDASNPFIKTLGTTLVVGGVHVHSIIGIVYGVPNMLSE